jgi:hypothetical protein
LGIFGYIYGYTQNRLAPDHSGNLAFIDLSENHIKQLHRDLLRHDPHRRQRNTVKKRLRALVEARRLALHGTGKAVWCSPA